VNFKSLLLYKGLNWLDAQFLSMKLPWKERKERIKELEKQVEKLEKEKEKLDKRFKAEKKRRKKHTRQKQEAEEQLNRLKDKIRSIEKDDTEEKEEVGGKFQEVSFGKAYRTIRKLGSLNSEQKDFVTVRSPNRVEDIDDLKGLKNAVTKKQYREISDKDSFIGFLDRDIPGILVKTVPFFEPGYSIEKGFDTEEFMNFVKKEKHWVLVSAGDTKIYREKEGTYEEVESVKSRIDRSHSSGGFSQGRFERKREEQIESHLEEVKQEMEDLENIYLLGDKRYCKILPGTYLGGFNPNRGKPGQFYRFQIQRL